MFILLELLSNKRVNVRGLVVEVYNVLRHFFPNNLLSNTIHRMPCPTRLLRKWLCVVALFAWPLTSVTSSYAAAPSRTLKLSTRSVDPESLDTLGSSGLVYIWSSQPLSREQLQLAEAGGLRMMGLVRRSVYAFEVGEASARSAMSRSQLPLVGTASVRATDKLGRALSLRLNETRDLGEIGRDLMIKFWPRATGADVKSLVGTPVSGELPKIDTAMLQSANSIYIPAEDARWLDLDTLLQAPSVASVDIVPPRVTTNAGSRSLSGTSVLAQSPYNLNGSGIWVGVWDGGPVDTSHGSLQGAVELAGDSSLNISGHATHVTGTIVARPGANTEAGGHAPGARVISFDFLGNVFAERRAARHALVHRHDNHSWGLNPDFIDDFSVYDETAAQFDIDARDLLLLPVKAAGNEGELDSTGYDSLSPDSTGKNMLVVGAVQSELDGSATIASFSSRGPVEDGRIKPDITALGVNVLSTVPGDRFAALNGTSMATPGVSGMLALLEQQFEAGMNGRMMAPDVARGLFIHTAQDVGNLGPDYRYGWGLARADRAGELVATDLTSVGAHIVRGALRIAETKVYTVEVPSGLSEMKFTMTWLDAVGNLSVQSDLVNDLDMVAVDPNGVTHQAWALNGENPSQLATKTGNSVDNVEQVLVSNPVSGTWQIRIQASNISDLFNPVQGYVLFSDHPVGRRVFRAGGDFNTPIGDGQTVEIPFEYDATAPLSSLRLFVNILHESRGDLEIELIHPDGTSAMVKESDASNLLDVFAIYPDTNSVGQDTQIFHQKNIGGTWRLRITDTQAGNTGTLIHADLELEVAGPPNRAPSASIVAPREAQAGQTVTLSGLNSSDPDGTSALRYDWEQRVGTALQMADPSLGEVSVTLPADAPIGSVFVFALTVHDDRGSSSEALHPISVGNGEPNGLPVVRVRAPRRVAPGLQFQLDASGTTDPDDDLISYRWRQISGPLVGEAPNTAVWDMVMPNVADNTEIELEVSVSDGRGAPILAQVKVVGDSNATSLVVSEVVSPRLVPEGGGCSTSGAQDVYLGLFVGLGLFLQQLSRLRRLS